MRIEEHGTDWTEASRQQWHDRGLPDVPCCEHHIIGFEDRAALAFLGGTYQPFESEIFGVGFGTIKQLWAAPGEFAAVLDACGLLLGAIDDWASERGVRYLSCRVPESELAPLRALEDAGFRFVETYVQLACELPIQVAHQPDSVRIRPVEKRDVPRLAEIAGNNLVTSRFHANPDLDDELARETRRRWVVNSCNGRAEIVLVAELAGVPVGFVLGKSAGPAGHRHGVLDLIAVDRAARRCGAGLALVSALLDHYSGSVSLLKVGTQGKNEGAIRFYEHCGFRYEQLHITMEKTVAARKRS